MHTRTLFAAITILLLFISASLAIVLADGPLPGVDTAERDDVVVEDDGGGASGAVDEDDGTRLPDVDTAERDDVVPEDDGGGASGAVDEDSGARLPDVDTAQRDDVVEEEGGASGAVDEDSEGRLPDVDTAQRDDVVEEEGGATGSAANAPAPTGLRVTSDTDDSVSLSWNAVTDAGAYKVEYRRSGSISWLHAGYVYSSTSDTVDGLDCNTSYYFQVRARGDGSPYSYTYGNPSSSVSETTDACPVPVAPAPTGLTVTSDTDDSVSLSWNAVTDAGAYKVEYRRSGSISWLHAGYVYSSTSDTVDGLDCNTSYYFQVRARGDGSPYSYTYGNPSSSVSETTDACVAPAPTGLTVTSDTDDSVSLSWNAVTDAHYYKVEYRRSSSSSWLHAGYTFGTSRTVSGLDPNTAYDFQVRARGDGSPYSYTYGSPSTSVSRTTDPPTAPAPTGLRATASTETSVSLSWNDVTDAGAYKVEYRRSSSISWLHAGYVYSSTSDTVDGLDCDTSYDFQVRARGDGSPYSYTYGNPSSGVSETTDACPVPAPPPAPQNLTGASGPGRGEASLNWDTVAEATGYKVEQRKRRTFAPFLHTWVDLGSEVTIIGSSAVVRNLSVNDAKRFRVKALNSDVESVPSNEVEVTLAPPLAPANVASSSVDHGEIQIMWDAVLDATGYVVEQHKNVFIGSDWRELPFDSFTVTTPLRSGNRFSAIVRGLTPGDTYKHRVKAVGVQGTSDPSSEVETQVLDERPPKPNKPAYRFLIGGRGIELLWDVVPGANSYKVLIDPEPNPPAAIAFTNASADITGLVPDSRYTFKVVATNRFGDSPESDGLRARTPDLEYWWGHQADHTAKYTKGTIGSSIIEDAIQDAAEDWNNEMVVLNKGLKICDDVDISCGGANADGGIVTIQTATTTKTNDSGGCGNSYACVQPGTDGNSSGPGKHMVNMTMVFEEPAYVCSGSMCLDPYRIVWTDDQTKDGDPTPSSTAADQEQYAFIDWVMLHEFGHTLGLPDFYADTSTLQGQIAIMNEHWVAQDIKDEDLEQLKAIYILHTSH